MTTRVKCWWSHDPGWGEMSTTESPVQHQRRPLRYCNLTHLARTAYLIVSWWSVDRQKTGLQQVLY